MVKLRSVLIGDDCYSVGKASSGRVAQGRLTLSVRHGGE